MSHDLELLARYVDEKDEQAFSELVSRHLNLVYSAAIRQLNGDQHLAADVVQLVFTDLARKSRELRNHVNLAGWLYTSSYYAASKIVRGEERRRLREESEHIMREMANNSDSNMDWNELRPVIDHAMHELSEEDRSALLLKFFQDKDVSEVAGALGVSTNAARMRVERALDKLRLVLEKRGITSTAAALSIILTAQSINSAPFSLGSGLASHAMAAAKASGYVGKSAAAVKWMSATKAKAAVVATLIAAGVTLPLAHHFLLRPGGNQAAGLLAGSANAAVPVRKPFNAKGGGEGDASNPTLLVRKLKSGVSVSPLTPRLANVSVIPQTNPASVMSDPSTPKATNSPSVMRVGSKLGLGIYGKVVLVGAPPPELEITSLAQDKTCGMLSHGPVFTRHYVVGEGNGLGNVVVYVKEGVEKRNYPIPSDVPIIDNTNCIFEPYVSAVRAGQKFAIRNSDPVVHNLHSTPKINSEFNFAQPVQNQLSQKSFPLPEVMIRMKCDVHYWMFTYVSVFDHPYFAVTDKNGNYQIPNLPPGNYVVEAYHLKAGKNEVKISGNFSPGRMVNFSLTVPSPQ